MKSRPANNKALVKAQRGLPKILHAPRAKLAGGEIVSALRSQSASHKIVLSLHAQFDEPKIVQTVSAQSVGDSREIVAAAPRQSESGFLSLAPGFSQVSGAGENEKPFQRFACHAAVDTRLKPGANEMVSLA